MSATAPPPADTSDNKGKRRVIVSEDLPLTVLTAVATTLVMNAIGLGRTMLYVGVAVSPLVADVIKNAFRGLRKRWLSLLAALLVLLGTAGRAMAARLRAREDGRVAAPAIASTAVLSAALTVALFTIFEIGSGNAMTFFGSHTARAAADRTPPRLTVPAGLTAHAPGRTVVRYRASAQDRIDGEVPAVCSPPSGAVFALGRTTVTCVATDDDGNRAERAFTVDVVKTGGGAILVVPTKPVTAEATGPDGASVRFPVSATMGATKLTPSCTPSAGSTFELGKTTVTCSAGGTSGRFEVVVEDTAAPTLHLLASRHLQAADAAGRIVVYTATATDSVDGAVPVRCAPASGSRFPVGTTPVRCFATDDHGNRAARSFPVTVTLMQQPDETAPELALPTAAVTGEATSASGAAVTYAATATDAVDGAVAVSCAPASGSIFRLGTTQVRCSAHDAHGNRAERSFTVSVVDTTAPAFAPLGTITAEATSAKGAAVAFQPTATDAVDGAVAPVCMPAAGSTFPLGSTPVSCTATDAHGNGAKTTFTVAVADTTKPTVSIAGGDVTVEATSARGAAVRTLPAASATDLVSGALPVVCSRAPGVFPVGATVVTCSAKDAAGNSGSATFTVNVLDRTPPRVTVPRDMTLTARNTATHVATVVLDYSATAVDIVDGSITPSCTTPPGTTVTVTVPVTTLTVTCTAKDAHGNSAPGASFMVTIHAHV